MDELEKNNNIKEIINNFINNEKITIEELRQDKRLIKKLYNSMEIKPSKTNLAKIIGINRVKISKILNNYKEVKYKK